MKKRIFVPILIVLVLGITSLIIFNNKNTIASTITLDINPSIKINLNKDEKVVSVVALNKDANKIISSKLKGKTIDETFKTIANNLIENGYTDDEVVVLVHTEGKITNKNVTKQLKENFDNNNIQTNIISIEKVTEKDEKLAKKYGITSAKASYINSIVNEQENVEIKNLIEQPINSLNETKKTGKYCDQGYTLEGDFCFKEIKRENISRGEVCPREYLEYEGKCYYEVPIEHTDKLTCREEFELVDNKCSRKVEIEAEPTKFKCETGEETTYYKAGLTEIDAGNADDIICIDTSNATHPVSPCETHDGTEYMLYGGKCYWHRAPIIAAGCPGKIQVNGSCWDDASGIYICEGYRDGKRYSSRSEYCEHSIKYINPIITEYKCPKEYTLEGNKCIKFEIEEAENEQVCPTGYNQVNNDKCIDYNKTINKEIGNVCTYENSKLKGNECIIYDIVDAKHD